MDIYATFHPKTIQATLSRPTEIYLSQLGLRIYWDQNGVDLDELEKNDFKIPQELFCISL
jgi:hypothetical protein